MVRKGNPKNIHSWDDLVKPGVKVVTPNPFSSGSARWNILAGYGQVLKSGGTKAQGEAYLKELFANIVAQPASGRDATQAFTGGTGDVLLSYENEAIFARQKGQPVDYVVPDTDDPHPEPGRRHRQARTRPGQGVPRLLLSTPGQKIFAQNGYRPVVPGINVTVQGANDPSNPFPTPAHLFTIAELGGWTASPTSSSTHDRIIAAIEQQTGVADCKKRRPPSRRAAATGRCDRPAPGAGQPAAARSGSGSPRCSSACWCYPARRGRRQVVRSDGWPAFWSAVTAPDALAALRLTVGRRCWSSLVNVVMGTLIAWVLVRDGFPGKRIARGRHRPAVRAAHHRGRPGAAGAVRAAEPAGRRTSPTPRTGGVPRAAVRHPAVRGPHRCSRC